MRRLTSRLLCAFVALATGGCRATLPDGSEPKIVNGTEITAAEYPAVVVLTAPDGQAACTGTFIGKRAILTAAHCVPTKNAMSFQNKSPKKVVIPAAHFTAEASSENADIAVLLFDDDVAPAVMPVGFASPEFETPFEIVGFGCTTQQTADGVGVKRLGKSQVSGIVGEDYSIYRRDMIAAPMLWTGSDPVGIADSCSGDSGGPMIIGGKVVATVSDSTWSGAGAWSFYCNLNTEANKTFLRQANGLGAGIAGITAEPATSHVKILE